jgi:hypothetical protein
VNSSNGEIGKKKERIFGSGYEKNPKNPLREAAGNGSRGMLLAI